MERMSIILAIWAGGLIGSAEDVLMDSNEVLTFERSAFQIFYGSNSTFIISFWQNQIYMFQSPTEAVSSNTRILFIDFPGVTWLQLHFYLFWIVTSKIFSRQFWHTVFLTTLNR